MIKVWRRELIPPPFLSFAFYKNVFSVHSDMNNAVEIGAEHLYALPLELIEHGLMRMRVAVV